VDRKELHGRFAAAASGRRSFRESWHQPGSESSFSFAVTTSVRERALDGIYTEVPQGET
jgi:hypothetical protein